MGGTIGKESRVGIEARVDAVNDIEQIEKPETRNEDMVAMTQTPWRLMPVKKRLEMLTDTHESLPSP